MEREVLNENRARYPLTTGCPARPRLPTQIANTGCYYELKLPEIFGIRLSDGRQLLCATAFADRGRRCLSLVLCAEHFCQPGDTSLYSEAPSKPGRGFRAPLRSGNHPAGFPGRFLSRCSFFSGWRSDQDLGISGVAIGFAFQNILQNFLAGLLLLWAEPFRIGDEIKLDPHEGAVEEIQTRATIIKTYDGRRVVIPKADLFTHSFTVNTALDIRRWEYDLAVKGIWELAELKSLVVDTVSNVQGVLTDPRPEVLVMDLGDPATDAVKVRVLWWTRAPRQHQMLASYDRVLTAIRQTLDRSRVGSAVGQDRAA